MKTLSKYKKDIKFSSLKCINCRLVYTCFIMNLGGDFMKQFIYPYILVKDAMAAANLYKEAFQGEVTYIMYGKDMPNCKEDELERIMHMELKAFDHFFYLADDDKEDKAGIHLHLDFEKLEDLQHAFSILSEEGDVIQTLGETSWDAIFGVVKDKFGVYWQVNSSV